MVEFCVGLGDVGVSFSSFDVMNCVFWGGGDM
jgi:hypothetical protein